MPFQVFRGFVETAFERRFQGVLRTACADRSWHVLVAPPGSGKTLGIRDLARTMRGEKTALGMTTLPLIAICASKGDGREQALGSALAGAFGIVPKVRWSDRKRWLAEALVRMHVQTIIIDDAQDLSLEHLILLKELTDTIHLPPYDYAVGLCLVTAAMGNTVPLKEVFDKPDMFWIQFHRRLDRQHPYCRILGNSREEVREIVATLEDVYRAQLPQLHLRHWSNSLYTWLTHPLLDPHGTGRVVMDHLMKLITNAVQWAYVAGQTDVDATLLEEAAAQLTIRRDLLWDVDGEGDTGGSRD